MCFRMLGMVYPVRDYIGSISAVVHAPFSLFHVRPYAEGGVEYDRFSPTHSDHNQLPVTMDSPRSARR